MIVKFDPMNKIWIYDALWIKSSLLFFFNHLQQKFIYFCSYLSSLSVPLNIQPCCFLILKNKLRRQVRIFFYLDKGYYTKKIFMTSFVKMYSGGPIYKFGLNSAIVVANSHGGITYMQTVLFWANITTYMSWRKHVVPDILFMYISCDMKLNKYTFSMLNITVTLGIPYLLAFHNLELKR